MEPFEPSRGRTGAEPNGGPGIPKTGIPKPDILTTGSLKDPSYRHPLGFLWESR